VERRDISKDTVNNQSKMTIQTNKFFSELDRCEESIKCIKNIPKIIINIAGSPNSCIIKINGQKFRALIDSGAEVSLIHSNAFSSLQNIPQLSIEKN
jgi:hypothetical protein